MTRRIFMAVSVALFAVGVAGVALTAWLWLGDWPQQARAIVAYERSARENAGRAPDPLIENVGARRTTSLGGTWKAVIDPYDRAGLLGLAPRAAEPGAPSDLAEFSFENGLTLEVPGDWNTQDPRLVFYQGVVWYQRRFDFQPSAGERSFLYFGAANYAAWVHLNGRLIGLHEGGFTPFDFDVTDALRPGENLLVVKVDSRHAPDDVPTPTTDWLNYGGLTRDVLLVHVPETFARSVGVRLAPEGDAVEGFVAFDGPAPPSQVRVALPELGAELRAPVVGGRASFRLAATPERWSPESPRLYRLEVGEAPGALVEEVGFRSLATRGREILLNGAPVFLRGISLHEESLGGGGRLRRPEQGVALLQLARELGCNFVRLAHYPHPEWMARAADRLGLLVWEEIPVYWNIAFDDPKTLARAETQLSEVIARDRNRASVAIWSIGNETPQTPERLRFMTALAEHVHGEDPTRLVTAALVTGSEALTPFVLHSYLPALLGVSPRLWHFDAHDPLALPVDVVAINEYFGWYYSGALAALTPFSSRRTRSVMLRNMDRIRMDPGAERPLVVSEMGAGAKAGWHAAPDSLTVFSEEYQAEVYRRQIAMLERQEGLAGVSPWVLKDFRSPLRLYQGVQDYWNRKGLVDEMGRRKLAFEVLRSWYRTLETQQGDVPSVAFRQRRPASRSRAQRMQSVASGRARRRASGMAPPHASQRVSSPRDARSSACSTARSRRLASSASCSVSRASSRELPASASSEGTSRVVRVSSCSCRS